ncbi:MAG: hypothetical protein P8P36_02715 [Akkermansiaceae bacterium]|nr:hypothetical protein [Akkermansiaceae bacterium]
MANTLMTPAAGKGSSIGVGNGSDGGSGSVGGTSPLINFDAI